MCCYCIATIHGALVHKKIKQLSDASSHSLTHSNHNLDLLYLFMRVMLVLPRLSTLTFTIGNEDEMLTVNMVPAASYQAGIWRMFSPGLCISLQTGCEVPYVYMCAFSKWKGSDGKQHHIACHASPLQEQKDLTLTQPHELLSTTITHPGFWFYRL